MHSNVSSWPPPLKSFLAPPNKIQYNTIYSKHFVSRKVVDCSRISDAPSKNVAGYVPVNGNYNRHSFLKGLMMAHLSCAMRRSQEDGASPTLQRLLHFTSSSITCVCRNVADESTFFGNARCNQHIYCSVRRIGSPRYDNCTLLQQQN